MHEEIRRSDSEDPVYAADPSATSGAGSRIKLGIEQLWFLFPVLLLIYKGFIFPLPPLDFWWHLKMGELIATTGSIPRVDVFSFTAAGRPFVLQNWLGELIYYWTYRAGGFPLLVVLGTALTLGAFLLMYKLCLNATRSLRIAAFVGFLACLANYSFLRPQTYSFLMFSAFYFVLAQYRERRRDQLWLLPLLMALWVNLHGAFVIGLGLIAIVGVCEALRRLIDPHRTDALSVRELRKIAVVFALCCLATLLNPEGLGIFDYVRTVILDAGSQQLVAEWQPPRVNDLLGFLLFYCPLFVAIFIFVQARVRPDLTEVVLFFVFAIFGLTAIRNSAWFATITFPLIARYLPLLDISPLFPLRRFSMVDRLFQSSRPESEQPVYGRINVVLLATAVAVLVSQSPWIRPAVTGKSLLAEQTPVGAADFIEKQGIRGRIFHAQEFGDYLIWRLWPQQRTVVDGRVHLYDLDFLKDYEKALRDPLSTDFMQRWNIEYLLLNKLPDGSNLKTIRSIEQSNVWTTVYEDRTSIMFGKQRG